jgi:pyridoxine 5'-phosphate synthase
MTRLSVNINKIATLRNSRGGNNPNLIQVAKDCERFGAQGITVHPRPDERHIRYNDVFELKKIVTTEFNIEGNCQEQKFIDLVLANKPEQVTLVPDVLGQITSNHGWDTIKNQQYLKDIIAVFKNSGIRVSIFVDPVIEMVEAAATTGTDRIEYFMKLNADYQEQFQSRHIAPNEADTAKMLKTIGVSSLDELIAQTIPDQIRLKKPLNLPPAKSEFDYLTTLKQTSLKNKVFKSFIGKGYYDVIVPGVIQRNILENPGWYTQYTPYQAEIAQGRLQALLNFQTMVIDLTGMEIANASLLDEGTAAAEAMFMQYSLRKNNAANVFFVSEELFPQTIDILKTRSEPYGIELQIGDHRTVELTDNMFGAIVQYPAGNGAVIQLQRFCCCRSRKRH